MLTRIDTHANGASLSFFFNDTATTEIYSLSLHDAFPISRVHRGEGNRQARGAAARRIGVFQPVADRDGAAVRPHSDLCAASDRKSTRLNSSHANISYAVFCLKK